MRSNWLHALAALLLLIALGGCWQHPMKPQSASPLQRPEVPVPAMIRAVVAPDSVADGQPITIKVQFYYGGCSRAPHLVTRIVGDSIQVDAWMVSRPWSGACPGVMFTKEAACAITAPRAGRWTLVVHALDEYSQPLRLSLPIEVGAAPAPIRRFDLRVADLDTGTPLAGLDAAVVTNYDSPTPNVLIVAPTGSDGCAIAALECGVDTSAYAVMLSKAGSRGPRFIWSPARCGVPERGIYLIRSRSVWP